MQCYDCLGMDRTTTAAAVCSMCGAAVCAEHVHEEREQIQELVGMGKATHDSPARKMLCLICARAEHRPEDAVGS